MTAPALHLPASASARSAVRTPAGTAGAVLCLGGIVLLALPWPLTAAIGAQAFALAFWIWARAAEDASEQLPRWRWLQRPATALWLAYAAPLTLPAIARDPVALASMRFAIVDAVRAVTVVWAGLELVAALPLARPYSDFPGPAASLRAWIPVALPGAGFLALWSQAPAWQGVAVVDRVVLGLLALTALLGALRAFARRGWTASLRWLAVSQTALALVPLAARSTNAQASMLLWLAAFGGPAFVLAGELAGATPRRGRLNARLWRLASGVSTAVLAWATLPVFLHARVGFVAALGYAAAGTAVFVSTWIMVGRLEVAPERRRLIRPGSGVIAGRLAAVLVLVLGPASIAFAWRAGIERRPWIVALALLPVATGAFTALAPRQKPIRALAAPLDRVRLGLRAVGGRVFRFIIGVERALLGAVLTFARGLGAPLRDLHTGDPQEYLLLLAGVAVLAVLLPLLR